MVHFLTSRTSFRWLCDLLWCINLVVHDVSEYVGSTIRTLHTRVAEHAGRSFRTGSRLTDPPHYNIRQHSILYYIILFYIILYYIILHYITLHYITLHYITLHYITLHYITLYYVILYYIILYYIILYYIILYYIILYYIILYYIMLYYIIFSILYWDQIWVSLVISILVTFRNIHVFKNSECICSYIFSTATDTIRATTDDSNSNIVLIQWMNTLHESIRFKIIAWKKFNKLKRTPCLNNVIHRAVTSKNHSPCCAVLNNCCYVSVLNNCCYFSVLNNCCCVVVLNNGCYVSVLNKGCYVSVLITVALL